MRCRAVSSHDGLDAVRSPNRFGGKRSDRGSRGDRRRWTKTCEALTEGFETADLPSSACTTIHAGHQSGHYFRETHVQVAFVSLASSRQ
jgi:hypothetical protein